MFSGCASLENVHIGDKVTNIDSTAFEGCTNLTSITIPDSVTSIGYGAFEGCTSLISVTIPDSVTKIGGSAFEGCTSLANIKYRGTQEQWNNISKDYHWDYKTGQYTITYNYDGE